MGRNLGPLNIKDSYEGLVQISGSDQLTDGSGSLISSLDVNAATATSASFATTASFALNVTPIDTGSLMVTGSVTDATLTFTKGDGSTFPLTVNNVANATSALLAVSASHAVNADNAITAQTASFLPADTNLNINSITASNASFTSTSIGYLQTITGSAKIIGDAFIILNNNLPTERYAGLVVQDSGSGSPLTTSSLQYDGQTDDWFYEYSTDGGVTVDHGIAMFGPEYSVKGVPTYLTNNTIPKGDGGHHLNDSNITDDGTVVTISTKLQTGNGNASGGAAAVIGGQNNSASGTHSSVVGGFNNQVTSVQGFAAGGGLHNITEQRSAAVGGYDNDIAAEDSAILGGKNNDVLSTHQRSVILGGDGLQTSKADEVVVPHLTISGSTVATDISASGYVSASTFIGDGSQLSGISTTPFPYTGSAEISGSLVINNDTTTAGVIDFEVERNGSPQLQHYSSETLSRVIIATSGSQDAVLQLNAGTGNNYIKTGQADDLYIDLFNGDVVISSSLSPSTNLDVHGDVNVYGETFISSSTLGTGSLIDNLGQEAIVTGSQVQHIVNLSQAEYDALTPDANTLYVIDGAETLGDTTIDGQLIGTVNTISDSGGTTALDCSVGNYFTLAMPAGGTTVLTPSNITAGQTINIKITQNATASTLTYAASIDFPGGTAFTISTGSGEVDVLTLVSFDGTTLQATGLANFS
jgi:hypothetical protein